MVSTADPEANWSQNQKQLRTNRTKNLKERNQPNFNTSIPRLTDDQNIDRSKKTLDRFIEQATPRTQQQEAAKGILKKNINQPIRTNTKPVVRNNNGVSNRTNNTNLSNNKPTYNNKDSNRSVNNTNNTNSNRTNNSFNNGYNPNNGYNQNNVNYPPNNGYYPPPNDGFNPNKGPYPNNNSYGVGNYNNSNHDRIRAINNHAATGTVRNLFTPLPNPSNSRNNTGGSRSDTYGINPLPTIRSPYNGYGYDEPQPNLESWGVPNDFSFVHNNRNDLNSSPFLPTYNLAKKGKKGYIIAPKFRRPVFQNSYQVDNDDDDNKLDYIAPIPYNNPVETHESENFDMRTKNNIQNVQKVLKTMDAKNYDGKDLFSTKFLDDLDDQETYKTPTPKPKTQNQNQRRAPTLRDNMNPPPPQVPRPLIRNPEADVYIHNIKKSVEESVPVRDYNDVPVFNSVTLDYTESIYNDEIEVMVREIAQNTINKELNNAVAYEKPIYDKIFEVGTNEMYREIASEILKEENKKVKTKDKNEIGKVAKEELVSNLMLDHMLDKMAQHGRVSAENEDIGKIMDGMIIDVLLQTNQNVHKVKDKTINNYPIKKFHLNSFMNVALDILVAELSTNLEEDMKDLEVLEQNNK